jgi:hypothetical protein
MALTQEQFNDLHAALLDAYNLNTLTMMLQFRLKKTLANIVDVANPFTMVVFDLIRETEREGWKPTLRLVNAALESRPENALLLRVAQQFELTALSPALEREVRQGFPTLDIDPWMAGLGRAQARVCQVIVRGPGTKVMRGTGFLVGPNVVVTNHHVVARVIDGTLKPSAVELRFDYKFLANGTTLNEGTPFELADKDDKDKCLIDFSPPSKVDTLADPGGALPAADELDYALLRVKGKPGEEPVSPGNAERTAEPRGWIEVPAPGVKVSFAKDDPLFIIQHPEGRPAQLALEAKAVLDVNGNGTRVRYTTNTENGSSGAPCFGLEWQLLALHHSGDPDMKRSAQWNEGIPFDLIVKRADDRLKVRGLPSPWGKQG